jgi:hypothetical protein
MLYFLYMSMDLKFEEEQIRPARSTSGDSFAYNRYNPKDRIPSVTRFLMKSKAVKNEEQANMVLIVVVGLLFILTAALLVKGFATPEIVRLQLTD